MQVLAAGTYMFANGLATVADGVVQNQEDPTFCTQLPASVLEVRRGSCPGADNSSSAVPPYFRPRPGTMTRAGWGYKNDDPRGRIRDAAWVKGGRQHG